MCDARSSGILERSPRLIEELLSALVPDPIAGGYVRIVAYGNYPWTERLKLAASLRYDHADRLVAGEGDRESRPRDLPIHREGAVVPICFDETLKGRHAIFR